MERNTRTNGQPNKEGYTSLAEDQLPALSADDLHYAATPHHVSFMADFMQAEHVGRYHWFENFGFTLQNAGQNRLRCIHVVDHEAAILAVAIAKETIRLAGGILELAPYTIVRPFVGEPKNAEPSQTTEAPMTGMEVA